MLKKALKWLLILVAVLLVVLGIAMLLLDEPLPEGKQPNDADALAKQMLLAVNDSAWKETKAIQWTFGGSKTHLWDRARHFDRMQWRDYTVWIDLHTKKGVAEKSGKALTGDELNQALHHAWESWCNDSFWLNPIAKSFDEGTTRRLVKLDDGTDGLLVSYSSGGVTPGDTYLWRLDQDFRPISWKMWVSLIPIGGLEWSWGKWQQLSTGAWIGTSHQLNSGITLNITNIQAGASLPSIVDEEDPFKKLAAVR